jgi:Tfp pilus assembly protein PilV
MRGLSLIEILLAFALLLVAILALLGLLPMALRQGTTSDSHGRALFAATQTMEDCLRRNAHGDGGTQAAPEVGTSGQIRWSTAPGPNGNTQIILVEVTWLEQNRPARLELKSLLYR